MGGLLGNLAYVSYIRHKWEESRHLMDKNDLLLQAEWERAKSTAKTRRMRLEQRAEQEVKEYLTPCKQLEFASKVLIKSKHLQDKKVSSTGDHHVTTTNLNNNHSGLVAHCI